MPLRNSSPTSGSTRFGLRDKWKEWNKEGELLAFKYAPDENDVRNALFAVPPVEWNRLPAFQDVTIRLIAERGILHDKSGELLYMQRERAMDKVPLPPAGRAFRIFCSEYNLGAKGLAEELKKVECMG